MCCSLSALAQSNKGDAILGDWMDSKKETLVHCYKQNGKYFAKLLWVENLEAIGKPLPPDEQYWINMVVMKDFEYKNDEWANGTIYQPKTDKTYSAYLKLKDNNSLVVVGYIFFRIFSQSELFTRVSELNSNR